MNEYAKIIGLKCTGLAFLSTVSLWLFWGLAQVLVQVSTIKSSTLRSSNTCGNQLVITVNKIYRFYMNAEIMCYNALNSVFPSRLSCSTTKQLISVINFSNHLPRQSFIE